MADEVKIIVTRDSGNYIGNNSNAIQFPMTSDYTTNDYKVIASTKAVYSAYQDMNTVTQNAVTLMTNITNSAVTKMTNLTNTAVSLMRSSTTAAVTLMQNSTSAAVTKMTNITNTAVSLMQSSTTAMVNSASNIVSTYTSRVENMETLFGIDSSGGYSNVDLTYPNGLNVKGNLTVSGSNGITTTNILPSISSTYTVGNASYKWKSVYANTAIVDSITNTTITTSSIISSSITTSTLTGTSITLKGTATISGNIVSAGSITSKNTSGSISLVSTNTSTGTNNITFTNAAGTSVNIVSVTQSNVATFKGNLTGLASTATKLATARKLIVQDSDGTNIGSSNTFNGTADVLLNLPSTIKASITGDVTGNLTGNVTGNVTGNLTGTSTNATLASTAVKLSTARKLIVQDASGTDVGSTNTFDGTGNVTLALPATIKASLTGNATTATTLATARNFYISDSSSTNTGAATSFNGSANATIKLPATIKATLTGNADTATKLATARTIWGQSFNGTANVTGTVSSVDAIEFTGVGTSANNGGYIDFRFNGSSADYTSRIIESASGTITVSGNLTASKVINAYYNDYAEFFPRGEETEPGDIIMLDVKNMEEKYIKAVSTNNSFMSPIIIGVHSDTYGHIVGGETPPDGTDYIEHNMKSYIPVGLTGRLWVKVRGVVSLGDYIVPSEIPGVGKSWELETDPCESIVGRVVHIDKVPEDTSEVYKVKIMIRH